MIAWIALPFVIPSEIAVALIERYWVGEQTTFLVSILPALLLLVVSLIWSAALIFYIGSVASGEPISVLAAWRQGFEYWPQMIAVTVLTYVVIGFGLVLFIIPGIYFGARLSFVYFELLFNNENPFSSMQISWSSTTGLVGKLIAGVLVFIAVIWFAYGLLAVLFDPESHAYWFFNTLMNIASSLLGAWFTIFLYRVYWLAMETRR